jgi:hypothetical protein
MCIYIKRGQSQWLHGLRHELSSPAQILRSWVWILLEAWMSVCVDSVCVVLYVGSGLMTGWFSIQRDRSTLYMIKKLKKWLRSKKRLNGERAKEELLVCLEINYSSHYVLHPVYVSLAGFIHTCLSHKQSMMCWNWGPHVSDYFMYHLLGCTALSFSRSSLPVSELDEVWMTINLLTSSDTLTKTDIFQNVFMNKGTPVLVS